MELMEGGGLARRQAGRPLPPADAARLVAVVAGAIHHAHRHGIIHRNLKPSKGLVAAGGTGKVSGLWMGKFEGDVPAGEEDVTVLGTPAYMPPEQAGGRAGNVGPAADVYGLGAILYELLTGRPPFGGAGLTETLQQVIQEEPTPVRTLQPR